MAIAREELMNGADLMDFVANEMVDGVVAERRKSRRGARSTNGSFVHYVEAPLPGLKGRSSIKAFFVPPRPLRGPRSDDHFEVHALTSRSSIEEPELSILRAGVLIARETYYGEQRDWELFTDMGVLDVADPEDTIDIEAMHEAGRQAGVGLVAGVLVTQRTAEVVDRIITYNLEASVG